MKAEKAERGGRLELRRVLPAARERVWEAWTDPVGMRRWMCPGGVEEARVELDVRKGGSFTIDMVQGEDEEAAERHRSGWASILDKLEGTLPAEPGAG